MYNLFLVFQRTILLPLTLMTILTDWLNVIKLASDAGVKITNREIESWTEQSKEDVVALEALQTEMDKASKELAAQKAKRRVAQKKSATEITKDSFGK